MATTAPTLPIISAQDDVHVKRRRDFLKQRGALGFATIALAVRGLGLDERRPNPRVQKRIPPANGCSQVGRPGSRRQGSPNLPIFWKSGQTHTDA